MSGGIRSGGHERASSFGGQAGQDHSLQAGGALSFIGQVSGVGGGGDVVSMETDRDDREGHSVLHHGGAHGVIHGGGVHGGVLPSLDSVTGGLRIIHGGVRRGGNIGMLQGQGAEVKERSEVK